MRINDNRRDMVDGKHVGGTDDAFEFRFGHGTLMSHKLDRNRIVNDLMN